jgi:glycosyltransferase involved in cell wall biosynthesis
MRIVNAMFGRGRGGLEQVFLDYCEALAHGGHEVLALIHPRAAIRPALERRGVGFHSLGNLGAWDPVAMLRLHSWLKQQAPDAVMAHGNRAISLLQSAGARPLIGVAANYTLKGAGLDAILCATQDLVRHCRSRGFDPDRINLIPHMVAAPANPPERVWHQPPVIGAMGRFVAKKGFDVLIEALARLDAPYRAIVAGDGAETAALAKLRRRHGLEDRIAFPGWQDDTAAFFDSIDVFCLPSLHEPFGIVLLEAMAQALPVIAADSEGPSEILHDGIDGMLVAKSDPAALAAAVERMLGDPNGARAMGLKAHATVRRNYSLSLLSTRLDEVLRTLVG